MARRAKSELVIPRWDSKTEAVLSLPVESFSQDPPRVPTNAFFPFRLLPSKFTLFCAFNNNNRQLGLPTVNKHSFVNMDYLIRAANTVLAPLQDPTRQVSLSLLVHPLFLSPDPHQNPFSRSRGGVLPRLVAAKTPCKFMWFWLALKTVETSLPVGSHHRLVGCHLHSLVDGSLRESHNAFHMGITRVILRAS